MLLTSPGFQDQSSDEGKSLFPRKIWLSPRWPFNLKLIDTWWDELKNFAKKCNNTKTYRWIDKNQNAYVNNLQQHAPKVWMLFSWIWTWESPSCLLVARNSPPKLSSSKIFIEHLSMGDDKQLFKVPKTTKIVTKQNCFGIMFIIVLH